MSKAEQLISPAELRGLLHYDPETGKLYREAITATNAGGYRRGYLRGCEVFAHRVAWAIVHGEWPSGEIDHIDGDPGNNRISNLRVVSHAENSKNQRKPKHNSSGVMGVVWIESCRRWRARISAEGRELNLGLFEALDDAVEARRKAEHRYGYHENHGRTVGE